MTKASPHAKRLLLLAVTTVLVVSAYSGSASGRAAGVQFVAGNSRVGQGNEDLGVKNKARWLKAKS